MWIGQSDKNKIDKINAFVALLPLDCLLYSLPQINSKQSQKRAALILSISPSRSPMEKLRESVIKLASSNLNAPLSSSQIALIDQRLHESFPLGLRVPSHPTYSTMVLKAITELNEEDGSSVDSICEYIKANYDDLPWAHKSILSHQLNRLCDDGLIALTATHRYSTPELTPKRVSKKGKLKRKHAMEKRGVEPRGSSCGEEGVELISERKLAHERCKLVSEENMEILGLESGDGIEDEHVKNGCRSLVVVEDKGEEKGQESEMFEEGGEFRRRKEQRKPDQLPTEEECLADECRDKTRNGVLALEDVSSGNEWMNNGASLKNPVKKKKKCAGNPVEPEIVCAIAKQFPKPAESGRRVTRQLSNSKQHSKKLISSPVSKFPSSNLQKHDNLQEALILRSPDNRANRDIVCGIAKQLPKPTESGRRVTRQLGNSKEQPKKLIILSPDSKFPRSRLWKHDNLQETKSNWPSWIPSLLQTDFNGRCKVHANVERSLCNLYCADCKNGALCSTCASSHAGHHVITIEQADFEHIVDVSDIEMLELSDIRTIKQSPTRTAIVLKRELTSWDVPGKIFCLFCKNRVPFPFKFCSLSCKFQHEVKAG